MSVSLYNAVPTTTVYLQALVNGGLIFVPVSATPFVLMTNSISRWAVNGSGDLESIGTAGQTIIPARVRTLQQTAPTVTSGCGTTPSVTGTDTNMQVTVGSGGTAATCTVTFAIPWSTVPYCHSNHEGAILVTRAVGTTATVVVDAATPFTAGGKINVWCAPGA